MRKYAIFIKTDINQDDAEKHTNVAGHPVKTHKHTQLTKTGHMALINVE